jgi:O-antigen/teichoic acid export membrane protein
MTVDAYGAYAIAVSWLAILTLFTPLGFNISYLRFIPQYRVNKDWRRLKGILQHGDGLVLGFSCLVTIATAILVFFVIDDKELRLTLLAMCLLLPLRGLNKVRQAALKALKYPVQGFFPEKVLQPVLLAVCCLAIFLISGKTLAAYSVMTMKAGVVVILFFITALLLHKKMPEDVHDETTIKETGKWLEVSLPLLFASGLTVVFARTDILMVGYIAGKEATGLYNAANRACTLLTLFYSTTIVILTPIVAEQYHSGQMQKLQRTIARGSALAAAGTGLVAIPFIVFGKHLLLLFGETYTVAYPVLLLLPMAYIFSATRVMAGITLKVTGHQLLAAKIMGVAVLINVLLNMLFIPRWGITGAAAATTMSIIAVNTAHLYYAKKYTQLKMTWLWFVTSNKNTSSPS